MIQVAERRQAWGWRQLASQGALDAGFKFGTNGPHSSRTMMLEDLRVLLERTPPEASLVDFRRVIVDENLLNKKTESTRRETLRRLRELYSLDAGKMVFQVLRAYWPHDPAGRPLLRATSISLCHDATWQKIGSAYASRNLRSRSSNGSERPFPKSAQAVFPNFCVDWFSYYLIDSID